MAAYEDLREAADAKPTWSKMKTNPQRVRVGKDTQKAWKRAQ